MQWQSRRECPGGRCRGGIFATPAPAARPGQRTPPSVREVMESILCEIRRDRALRHSDKHTDTQQRRSRYQQRARKTPACFRLVNQSTVDTCPRFGAPFPYFEAIICTLREWMTAHSHFAAS